MRLARRLGIRLLIGLVMIWVVAIAGYEIAKHAKVTPERVQGRGLGLVAF